MAIFLSYMRDYPRATHEVGVEAKDGEGPGDTDTPAGEDIGWPMDTEIDAAETYGHGNYG